MTRTSWFLLWAAVLAVGVAAQDNGEVTVYTSLDIEFSRQILQDFEATSGIKVLIDHDTEANKTVGLVNKIISEAKNPRCDVFWNNEVGQTIRLKNKGLLQPYVSPNAADIPAGFKDAQGYWTGFAARARVLIYNTDLVEKSEMATSLTDLTAERWAGKITMAKPLTGTTMTHAAALFAVWGEQRTKEWLGRLKNDCDIFWSRGNAMCMRDVGKGLYSWGYTDTDDANVARVKGYPTDIVVPDQGDGGMGTLVIPNSVTIIKGARNLENAKKVVDYLLSKEVERRLAHGRSAQIPLHPGVDAPPGVLKLSEIKAMDVDWEKVGAMLEQHKDYLHRLFEGGGERAGEKSRTMLWVLLGIVVVVVLIALGRRSAVS